MRPLAAIVIPAVLLLLPLGGLAQGPASAGDAADAADAIQCLHAPHGLEEERFVRLGGIDQWITIKGRNCSNPVVLFLHGGPGNPMSPYADALYGDWQDEFTLVQWDQRGAGKTFGRNPGSAETELTIEQMTQDGIELASYLTGYLGAEKIILVGGSWGSILGVHMAYARPELLHAYVGVGQIVEYRANLDATYRQVTGLARAAGDEETLATLEALGPPPWTNPRNFGIVRRATRAYEAKTTTPAPASWWTRSPQYATPQALADYEGGEDNSYLQFVGYKGDGMYSRVDLPMLGTRFQVPVFLLQGAQDLVTTADVSMRYFDAIEAPNKDYVLLERTGHNPNQAMVEATYKVLIGQVVPLIR